MSVRGRRFLWGATLLVCAVGAFAASEHPDTLEHFLESTDADPATETEETPAPETPGEDEGGGSSPFADYRVDGIESPGWSTFLAGLAGVLATFGLLSLLGALARAGKGSGGNGRERSPGPSTDHDTTAGGSGAP